MKNNDGPKTVSGIELSNTELTILINYCENAFNLEHLKMKMKLI